MTPTVAGNPRKVLIAIASGQLGPSPSNAALAELAGIGERTASRHIAALARQGLIVIERRAPNAHGPGSDPVGRSLYITADGKLALT
jgi:DNA-binding transcriptional MocR family regulator